MNHERRIILIDSICGVAGCIIFLTVVSLFEQLYWQAKFKIIIKTSEDFLSIIWSSPYKQIPMRTYLLLAFDPLLFAADFIGLRKMLSFDKKDSR